MESTYFIVVVSYTMVLQVLVVNDGSYWNASAKLKTSKGETYIYVTKGVRGYMCGVLYVSIFLYVELV